MRIARRLRAAIALVLTLAIGGPPPAIAQAGPSLLRDTETERFLNGIADPLAQSAGLAPGAIRVNLVADQEINAFVIGRQEVYLNSGLILAADSAGEVEGVIAHELGHIEGGHVPLAGDNMKGPGRVALLSLLLGLAALAAGGGEAGMAALGAGTQLAQGQALAFSRAQEGAADASAVRHLDQAHVSGRGLLSFFGKMRQEEYRLSSSYASTDPFLRDHPMSADRQASLEADVKRSRWYDTPEDPAKTARFLRVKAKLAGYVLDPTTVLRRYPLSDQSVPGHYARAFAYHRGAYPDQAVREADALLATAPDDPYFNELMGQMQLENGHPKDALPYLRKAVAGSGSAPLISAMLGHALLATEDKANFAEAERVLRVSVAKDREDPLAWYALGVVYADRGDTAHAALATAERYAMNGDDRLAGLNAETALRGFKPGTVDYLRAEDIAIASRNNLDWKERRK